MIITPKGTHLNILEYYSFRNADDNELIKNFITSFYILNRSFVTKSKNTLILTITL